MEQRKTPPGGDVEARLAALERRVFDLENEVVHIRIDVDGIATEFEVLGVPPEAPVPPLDAQRRASRPE